MSRSRLRTALSDALVSPPAGEVAVMRPPATYDVAALDRGALRIVHGFFPDVQAWEGAGFEVTQTLPPVATAIVVVPRSKRLAQAMLAEACMHAKLVLVDGQKTDGVDSLFRACRKRLGDLPSLTQGHGRLFWFAARDVFADWAASPPAPGPHGFVTTAGVFSDGVVDPGSALLAAALPRKLPARMADLGAGWGYLAGPVLARDGVRSLDLIEAEALAVSCARQNVTDPRATVRWGDATDPQAACADGPYDGIVMNPPFHTGRQADPALGRAFIGAAAAMLAPQGKLWMVANRHLPYEDKLRECFRNVDMIAQNGAFKVFHANRPARR